MTQPGQQQGDVLTQLSECTFHPVNNEYFLIVANGLLITNCADHSELINMTLLMLIASHARSAVQRACELLRRDMHRLLQLNRRCSTDMHD